MMPVRHKHPWPLGLESSTLPLNHCAPSLPFVSIIVCMVVQQSCISSDNSLMGKKNNDDFTLKEFAYLVLFHLKVTFGRVDFYPRCVEILFSRPVSISGHSLEPIEHEQ